MPSFGLPSPRAAASRRNGKKSRGPKTAQGKAQSSKNALKHGLRAHMHVVLPGEDPAEFEAFSAGLIDELAPKGALQAMLAERVVAAAWRLRRAERLEGEVFEENSLPSGGLGLALIRDANRARAFDTLIRYRGSTLAEFWRTLRTLKALQAEAAERAEGTPPAPAQLPPAKAAPSVPVPSGLAAAAAQPGLTQQMPRPNEPKDRGIADGSLQEVAVVLGGEAGAPGTSASLLSGTALVRPPTGSAAML